MLQWVCSGQVGSSLLARGAHSAVGPVRQLPGLIPARAGSTLGNRSAACAGGAHPRSRGEHVAVDELVPLLPGSSPLARGAHGQPVAAAVTGRLIPARAGSTQRRSGRGGARWAHPRSRGEHAGVAGFGALLGGSSPLARGVLPDRLVVAGVGRLIPARAGSTVRPRSPDVASRAHPRSRGEHKEQRDANRGLDGSSPLARGAHAARPGARAVHGLIPARAGST